jgi:hypothetical protein
MTDLTNDIDEYGESFIRASQRWATNAMAPQLQQIQGELNRTRAELTRQKTEFALDKDPALASSWRQQNNDPEFLKWLAAVDDMAGEPRQTLLNRAVSVGNVAPVLALFKAFRASQIPTTQRSRERVPFENGPGQPTLPTATDARGRRMWRRAEIAAFYEEKRLGKWNGREAEALRTERDILAAPRENRVLDLPMTGVGKNPN